MKWTDMVYCTIRDIVIVALILGIVYLIAQCGVSLAEIPDG